MSHPAHLNARDVSLALVSRAELPKLLSYRDRMGWSLPWYSSHGSDFNYDFNATNEHGENHVASVFLRDGDDIYRTYYTDARGIEQSRQSLDLPGYDPVRSSRTLGTIASGLAKRSDALDGQAR